jgi:FkbM family methyltransferase
VLNAFPFEQTISTSKIIAHHKRCGVSALINSQGIYNYNNMKLLQDLLQEGGTFFDVGANIGSYSLVASEQPEASVFAFEPHPVTFRMLKENIELNRRDNVRLFNIALGAMDGEVFLTDDQGSAVNHLVDERLPDTISVKCRRGETFCREENVAPTYMKIDVEGFEYQVLVGFGSWLQEVDLLFIEINGLSDERSYGENAIHRILTENGFRGPLYCDFDARTISADQSVNKEDCLYLSRSFSTSPEFMKRRFGVVL